MSVVWLAIVSTPAIEATPDELCRFSASVSARVDKIADSKLIRLHAVELYGGEMPPGPSANIICIAHICSDTLQLVAYVTNRHYSFTFMLWSQKSQQSVQFSNQLPYTMGWG